jgi:hypothetical protein
MFNNETVQIWLDDLLETTGKATLEELTAEEIRAEIEEVQGTISNERLWAHADSIHEENIIVLLEYLDVLNEMLADKEV